MEFSLSSKVLYISGYSKITIFKFDDLLATSTPTAAMGKSIAMNSSLAPEALQMGPDGRIYRSEYLQSYMTVIDTPDDYNNPRIFTIASGFLGTSTCRLGLPSFSASWFDVTPQAKKFACTGYNYKFTTNVDVSGSNAPVKLTLDYGDGNTGVITLVAGKSSYDITHIYATAGTYTVKVTPVKADNSVLASSTVSALVIDCMLESNRMIRVNLQNLDTKTTGQ